MECCSLTEEVEEKLVLTPGAWGYLEPIQPAQHQLQTAVAAFLTAMMVVRVRPAQTWKVAPYPWGLPVPVVVEAAEQLALFMHQALSATPSSRRHPRICHSPRRGWTR